MSNPAYETIGSLPAYAINAFQALIDHEEVHAKGDQCYHNVVAAFPAELRAYLDGYNAACTILDTHGTHA